MTTYTFNKHVGKHRFCPTCGSSIIATVGDMFIFNVRTVDGIDIDKLRILRHDGRKL